MKRMIQQYLTRILGMLALTASILTSCAIENDIPYPIIEASIESMTVEGQRGADQNTFTAATINKSARTVTLYVNDLPPANPQPENDYRSRTCGG